MPPRSLSLKAQWQPGLAGGCPKHDTYGLNPQFVLTPTVPGTFSIELQQIPSAGSALLPIGLVMLTNKPGNPFKTPLSKKKLVAKTSYKAATMMSLSVTIELPPAGTDYVILPSTFDPDQYSAFKLTVTSDDDPGFTLAPRDERSIAAANSGAAAAASAAVAAGARSRAPPAPPSGQLRPEDDVALSSAIERMREEPGSDGKFEDSEFRTRTSAGAGGKSAINNKLLYISGHAGPTTTKVDSWGRLGVMSGKGPATSAGSQMVYRRSLTDLWLLNALGMMQTRRGLLARVLAYSDESAGLHAVSL